MTKKSKCDLGSFLKKDVILTWLRMMVARKACKVSVYIRQPLYKLFWQSCRNTPEIWHGTTTYIHTYHNICMYLNVF